MNNFPVNNEPLSMKSDKELARALEQTEAPTNANGDIDINSIQKLEK